MSPTNLDRAKGAMLGLAIGDALGTTLEFVSRENVEPISDMVGGGIFKLAPGQWTDDTSMAWCLAASLIECGGFDPEDQMRRYLRWYREGCYSSIIISLIDIGLLSGVAFSPWNLSAICSCRRYK